jgi:hypothetical protein
VQRLGAWGSQIPHQHFGDLGRNVFATIGYGAHGGYQFCWIPGFVQVPIGTGAQTPDRVLIFSKHGNDQNPDRRIRLSQARKDLKSATAREIQVQQQYIACGRSQDLPNFGVASGFCNDLDINSVSQRVANTATDHCMVVTKNNSYH